MNGQPRVAPHDLDAEESLLGATLLSRDAIATALETVRPEHFYKPANGHILDAVTACYNAGDPADPISVADELRRAGLLDAVGGPAVLVALQTAAPAPSSARRHAEIVHEMAVLRSLINTAGEIAELGYSLPDDVEKAVDVAQAMVFNLVQDRRSSLASSRELMGDVLDNLEAMFDRGDSITGLPTGYERLDSILSGLQPSTLIVVGARPSQGKTSLALGMAAHAALAAGRPALVFSLEMSKLEIEKRIVQSELRINATKMRNGQLTQDDWDRITRGTSMLADAPLWVDDNPAVTVMDIRSRARKLKAETGDLGLVVVDYIQLMTGRNSAESRQVEVAEISRGLKILARELEVPVVALAQLSRGVDSRADKRPIMSDIKESGALEQDADVILFLYRDEMYNPETKDQGIAEVIVAKHRSGPTGTVRLAFLPQYTKFANMARSNDPL